MKARRGKIGELRPDPNNMNAGTPRGMEALRRSIRAHGISKPIVADAKLRAIAGNKTLEAAEAEGYSDVVIVDADKSTLVVIRRTDLDFDDGDDAQELAIADNHVASVNLAWHSERLARLHGRSRCLELLSQPELSAQIAKARRQAFDGTREALEQFRPSGNRVCPNCNFPLD